MNSPSSPKTLTWQERDPAGYEINTRTDSELIAFAGRLAPRRRLRISDRHAVAVACAIVRKHFGAPLHASDKRALGEQS